MLYEKIKLDVVIFINSWFDKCKHLVYNTVTENIVDYVFQSNSMKKPRGVSSGFFIWVAGHFLPSNHLQM